MMRSITEALDEAFSRKIIVKVALSHHNTAVNAQSLVPNLAQRFIVWTFSAHYLFTLDGLKIPSTMTS